MGRRFGLISDWEVLIPLRSAFACLVFLLWLGLPWFFWRFLFLVLIALLHLFRINHVYFVAAKSQLVSSGFEMLRTDILLGLCIGPLKSCCDQLHQMVHEHPPAFLRIEEGMREPGIHASGPLLQIQCGKRWAINVLQGEQNITHFPLGMTGNPTVGVNAIQPPAQLYPHRFWLVKDIFEGDGCPAPCGHQAQSQRMRWKG